MFPSIGSSTTKNIWFDKIVSIYPSSSFPRESLSPKSVIMRVMKGGVFPVRFMI